MDLANGMACRDAGSGSKICCPKQIGGGVDWCGSNPRGRYGRQPNPASRRSTGGFLSGSISGIRPAPPSKYTFKIPNPFYFIK